MKEQSIAHGSAGHQTADPPPVTADAQPVPDGTTRYLEAAAHLDPAFADLVVDEYLAEPRRSIPASPGVDAAKVLSEAIAARHRRAIRDGVLTGLMAVLLLTNWVLFAAWLVTGIVAHGRITISRTSTGQRQPRAVDALFANILWLPAFGVCYVLGMPQLTVLPLLVGVLVLAALVADQQIEWLLVSHSFARSPSIWAGERRVRSLGVRRYATQLAEIARQSAVGNVVVFRGRRPFVGSGQVVRQWTMALPLLPEETSSPDGTDTTDAADATDNGHHQPPGDQPVQRFTPTDVYRYVRGELLKLRSAVSLAPSDRLRLTKVSNAVLVSASGLVDQYHDPRAGWVLPDPDRRPVSGLVDGAVTSIANQPVEWMRCFQRCHVETWDRQLVVSTFFHVGCADRMLYLEWTCCALYPIANRYRWIDQPHDDGRSTAAAVLAGLVELPATLIGRVASVIDRLGDPGGRKLPRWLMLSDTYGANASIREHAAGGSTRSYFEDTDVQRYASILSRRTMSSINDFLAARGIATGQFRAQAQEIINNFGTMNVVRDSVVSGSVAAGSGASGGP